jgi:hypothetical protein
VATSKRRKPTTAAELRAQLAADPVYQARKAEVGAEAAERYAQWRAAEQPLVKELREAGFDVESVWDLVNTPTPYPDALPILLDHLPRDYPKRIRSGIARSLAVPDAAFGWDVLVAQYRSEPDGDARDGLAAALAQTVTEPKLDDLIRLIDEQTCGGSRVLLLPGLKRVGNFQAIAKLNALASDPLFENQANRVLAGSRSEWSNRWSTKTT